MGLMIILDSRSEQVAHVWTDTNDLIGQCICLYLQQQQQQRSVF